MTELLTKQIDCTLDHNDVVPLLLGLWKVLEYLSVRVETGTAEALLQNERNVQTAHTEDEDLLMAVLGLLSVRRSLRLSLSQFELDPSSLAAASSKPTVEKDLLR